MAPLPALLAACGGVTLVGPAGTPSRTADSGEPPDTAAVTDTGTTASRCVELDDTLTCAHDTVAFTVRGEAREVHFALPAGEPPDAGWPVAVLFQPSYISAEHHWTAKRDDAVGLWWQVATTRALLDAGWAMVTPEARGDGSLYWDTNIAPWNAAWESSADHALMLELLAAIDGGAFGPLDGARLSAAGMSSGGYMTSRMAVSYPGRFSALAVHSASYATCIASACAVPALPDDHPPTLFLHGERDTVVPAWTMELYLGALVAQGTEADAVVDTAASHEWIEAAPEAILEWFGGYGG